jgi:hypothetical protein
MKFKMFVLFIALFVLIFTFSCGGVFTFGQAIKGTMTIADNKDADGYYWKDFHFTPVSGSVYTVTMSASDTALDFHVAESDTVITPNSGPGTIVYRPTFSSAFINTHVSIYTYQSNISSSKTIDYEIVITKGF